MILAGQLSQRGPRVNRKSRAKLREESEAPETELVAPRSMPVPVLLAGLDESRLDTYEWWSPTPRRARS